MVALILVPMCVCQYFLNRKINKKKIWYDKVQEILYTKMQSINNLFIDRNALCEIKVFGTFSFLDSKRIHFLMPKNMSISSKQRSARNPI